MTAKSLCWMVFALIWLLLFCLFMHLFLHLLANLAQTGLLWEGRTSTEKALFSNLPVRKPPWYFLDWQLMWKNPAHWEQHPLWVVINGGIRKPAGQATESKALQQRSSMVSASVFVSVFLPWVPTSVITWLHCMWLLESCFLLTGCPSGS